MPRRGRTRYSSNQLEQQKGHQGETQMQQGPLGVEDVDHGTQGTANNHDNQAQNTINNQIVATSTRLAHLQLQFTTIASQLHGLNRAIKFDFLRDIEDISNFKSPTHGPATQESTPLPMLTRDKYVNIFNGYTVATQYLTGNMDERLFAFLPEERSQQLTAFKSDMRNAKHAVQSLELVNDSINYDHYVSMQEWYKCIQIVKVAEEENYMIALKRRHDMKKAENLSNDLVHVLDYETKNNYNTVRNDLIKKKNLDNEDRKNILELERQVKQWKKNLNINFLFTKYSQTASNTKTVLSHMRGKNMDDESKKNYATVRRFFIKMNEITFDELIQEDEKIGQNWVQVNTPNATEDLIALGGKKHREHNLRWALQLECKKKISQLGSVPNTLTLEPGQLKKIHVPFISSLTKIMVFDKIFKPSGVDTIFKLETGTLTTNNPFADRLIKYCRDLYNPGILPVLAEDFQPQPTQEGMNEFDGTPS